MIKIIKRIITIYLIMIKVFNYFLIIIEKVDNKLISDTNIGRQYIDFKKFCEIMKVFNYKTTVEEKIKCII
jgi:Ca2+-binding EF-hand superfamily protein